MKREDAEVTTLETESLCCCIDDLSSRVKEVEEVINMLEQFYNSDGKEQLDFDNCSSFLKEKVENHLIQIRTHDQVAAKSKAAAEIRMAELVRQFAITFDLIVQHKWAWPFMQPVDVEGLGLHDYFEVIEKPMDFSSIKRRLEAKDGMEYKNVRDIYSDVRLVFKNAMKYNDERDDVHVMAKTLLERIEEKWLQLLPKVAEEEKRREEEETAAEVAREAAHEASYAQIASDLGNDLCEMELHLDQLKELMAQKCRKLSTGEKRKLGIALAHLTPEDLTKALEIVAQCSPSFQATAQEVDLDIDAQSELTLWRLKIFVSHALKPKDRNSAFLNGEKHSNLWDDDNVAHRVNRKRRRHVTDGFANPLKRNRKTCSPTKHEDL